MFLGAETDFDLPVVDVMHEIFGPAENVGRVEDGAGSVSERVVLGVVIAPRPPFVDIGLEGVPVRVAARGIGLTDSCVSVADADRSFFSDGVGELGEASVFLCHDECLIHHSSSS